jgi:hypothetical protein
VLELKRIKDSVVVTFRAGRPGRANVEGHIVGIFLIKMPCRDPRVEAIRVKRSECMIMAWYLSTTVDVVMIDSTSIR